MAVDKLALLTRATRMLAECTTVSQAKHIVNIAKAAELYAREAKLGDEAENHAYEIRIRALRKLGEMLKEGPKNAGSRGVGRSGVPPKNPTLPELGLTKKESSTAQKLATLPLPRLEAVAKREESLGGAIFGEKRTADIAAAKVLSPPTGKYSVIVVDPPWPYETRTLDETHRGNTPYAHMALDDIDKLTLPADDDCILWLWTTNAFLHHAFHCVDFWGFQEKTILTWVKPQMGLGNWLRNRTEHCIVAVRGSPTVDLTNQTTVLEADRTDHSVKPDAFYAMVETLCPYKSRLDMFARGQRNGWTSWGAEVSGDG